MSSKAEKEHREEVRAHLLAIESRLGIANRTPHLLESHDRNNAANETSNDSKNAYGKVEPIPTPIQTHPQVCHCQNCCAQNPKPDLWKIAKRIIEIAGVVLLAVYTGYTIKMYRANKIAAEAAKSAADTARIALVESNRSWLEISLDQTKFNEVAAIDPDRYKKLLDRFKEFQFVLNLKTLGNAPIKNIQVQSGLESEPWNRPVQPQYFPYPTGATHSQNVMFPDQPTTTAASKEFYSGHGAVITDADREKLLSGDEYLTAFARGTFSDDFGNHWVQFCTAIIFSHRGGEWMDCVGYNNTGDGTPPWVEPTPIADPAK